MTWETHHIPSNIHHAAHACRYHRGSNSWAMLFWFPSESLEARADAGWWDWSRSGVIGKITVSMDDAATEIYRAAQPEKSKNYLWRRLWIDVNAMLVGGEPVEVALRREIPERRET